MKYKEVPILQTIYHRSFDRIFGISYLKGQIGMCLRCNGTGRLGPARSKYNFANFHCFMCDGLGKVKFT